MAAASPLQVHAQSAERGVWVLSSNVVASIVSPEEVPGPVGWYAMSSSLSPADLCTGGFSGAAGGGGDIPISPLFEGVNVITNGGLGSGTCVSPGTYYLLLTDGGTDVLYYWEAYFDGVNATAPDAPSCLGGEVGTCINTVLPYDGETVSTSTPTTIGADGYLDPADYVEGARIRFKLDRQTDGQAVGALVGWNAAFGNWTTFSLTSGAFDVSTTSIESLLGANREGEWSMQTVIQVPSTVILGQVFSYRDVEAITTRFVYGQLTGIDIIQNHGEDVLGAVIGASDPFAYCQFDLTSVLDFSEPDNLLTCILGLASSLIVPNSAQLAAIFDAQKNEFLSKPPFAYPYLAGTALLGYNSVGTTTITDSNLTITFPSTGAFASSSAGSVAGATITFIDWGLLAENLDTAPVHAGMDDLYDFIQFMMSVAFLLWLWYFGTRYMLP